MAYNVVKKRVRKVDDNYEGKIIFWTNLLNEAISNRKGDDIGYCSNKLQYFIHKQNESK